MTFFLELRSVEFDNSLRPNFHNEPTFAARMDLLLQCLLLLSLIFQSVRQTYFLSPWNFYSYLSFSGSAYPDFCYLQQNHMHPLLINSHYDYIVNFPLLNLSLYPTQFIDYLLLELAVNPVQLSSKIIHRISKIQILTRLSFSSFDKGDNWFTINKHTGCFCLTCHLFFLFISI